MIAHSLRRTLLLAAGFGIFLPALLLAIYQFGFRFEKEIDAHVNERMEEYLHMLSRGIGLAIWTADYRAANELTEGALRNPEIAGIEVFNEFGELIAEATREDLLDGPLHSKTIDVVFDGHTIGSLTLRISPHKIIERLRDQTVVLGISLLAQLLLSFLFIYLLIKKRILEPLTWLQNAARRLVHGDLKQPIESTRKDEIGELFGSINAMRLDLAQLLGQRDRSENQLRINEERFRIISSITNDVIFTAHADPKFGYRIDWVSGDVQGLFGCASETIVQQGNWGQLMDEADAALFEELAGHLRPGGSESCEFQIRKQRQARTVSCSLHLANNVEPSAANVIYGALRDISERKRTEEALRLAHTVFQQSSQAIVIADANLQVVGINPAFTRLTGYREDDIVGNRLTQLESANHPRKFFGEIRRAMLSTGTWEGEIWNQTKPGQDIACWLTMDTVFDDDGKPHRLVALFHDITEKKRSEAVIWNQANYDMLTHLPNRRLFIDRLDQEIKRARRDKTHLAVFFIDLDGFKEVNDSLGHHKGDELLIEAAERITRCVRETDTVARLGGDEFTITFPGLSHPSDLEPTANDILVALKEPFQLGPDNVFVSASIGITSYPDDAQTVSDMLRAADQAMYAAKQAGRNRLFFYSPSLEKSVQARFQMAAAMRNAIDQTQFRVAYQPIVDLRDGSIPKAEALLRWNHPQLGEISPTTFVPLAEDTGLINPIGEWVFKQAIDDLKRFREAAGSPFQLSFNVSPVQLRQAQKCCPRWIDYIRQNLPDARLVVEITEGVLMHPDENIVQQLHNLIDAGIQIAIDDFGTGYSSLAYLKKFDIDYIKIDRTFTRNLYQDSEDYALCEAIVVMAHKLGLKVIAEGVENERQLKLLRSIQCDYGQGFMFSPAIPATDFIRKLTAGKSLVQANP